MILGFKEKWDKSNHAVACICKKFTHSIRVIGKSYTCKVCGGCEIEQEPTYFREKIILGSTGAKPCTKVLCDFTEGFHKFAKIEIYPKLHTIRLDPHNRWKAGRSIQMAYGVRTKNYNNFNKGIPELETCVSVQNIEIVWEREGRISWRFRSGLQEMKIGKKFFFALFERLENERQVIFESLSSN